MRRPHSATKQDFYAEELLGSNDKSQLFAHLLTEAVTDPSSAVQHLYAALDMLIEARTEGKGAASSGAMCAVSEELREKLTALLKSDGAVRQGTIVDLMKDLSQQIRCVVKEVNEPETGTAVSLVWKLAVAAVDRALGLVEAETEVAHKGLQEELRAGEARIVKAQAAVVADLQGKVAKGQEEIKRLTTMVEHLRTEKTTLLDLLRDRDDEISSFKLPPNLKDFDRLLDEMSSYLEEAEGRQVSQASILETISVMLDTTRLKSSKRRQKKLTDSPGSAANPYPRMSIRGSPMQRMSVRGSPLYRPSMLRSPPKLQLGEKAFFKLMNSEKEGDGGVPEPGSAIAFLLPEKQPVIQDETDSDSSEGSGTTEQPPVCDGHAQTDLVGEVNSTAVVSMSALRLAPTNPLLRELEAVTTRQSPVSESAVLRFMEAVFEEKFRMDVFREEQRQDYDQLAEFAVSYVYTQCGLRSVARKSISGVMSGVEKMVNSGQEYAQLVCKLLGVFNCGYIPLELETFIMKAQAAFVRLHPTVLRFAPELGGSAPFVEVSDLISLLFKHRWDSAGRVLDYCCPREMTEVEVVCALLCGKLGKLGRDLKYFFVQVDVEKCGSIGFKAFCEGIRHVLGLALSWEKIGKLWATFDCEKLTFQQLSTLNFKEHTQRAESRHAYVTRCQFVTGIVREYEHLVEGETNRISAYFRTCDASGDGVLTLEEFGELVRTIDPEAAHAVVVRLFRQTLEASKGGGDALDRDAFCRIVIEEKLGGMGKFGFSLRWQNCDAMLRQIMERDYEVGSPRNIFKKKAKKAG